MNLHTYNFCSQPMLIEATQVLNISNQRRSSCGDPSARSGPALPQQAWSSYFWQHLGRWKILLICVYLGFRIGDRDEIFSTGPRVMGSFCDRMFDETWLQVCFQAAGGLAPLLAGLVAGVLFVLWGLGSAIPGGPLWWFFGHLGLDKIRKIMQNRFLPSDMPKITIIIHDQPSGLLTISDHDREQFNPNDTS